MSKRNKDKGSRIVAGILLILMVTAWIVICKPFSTTEEYLDIIETGVEGDYSSDSAPAVEGDVAEKPDDIALDEQDMDAATVQTYQFRNQARLDEHYEKHGREMGFASAKDYEAAASAVITNPNALFKTEAEDGDYVYYIESSNELVILSTDGYIRTYFNPSSGIKFFNKQ